MPTQTIWKYELNVSDQKPVSVPIGAQLLKVGADPLQANRIFLWFLVDPAEQGRENRQFRVFGTGHPVSIRLNVPYDYVDTVMTMGGALVWHVFKEE